MNQENRKAGRSSPYPTEPDPHFVILSAGKDLTSGSRASERFFAALRMTSGVGSQPSHPLVRIG
jgi:hypothetical protein